MCFANVFLSIILSLLFSKLQHLLFPDFSAITSSAPNLPPWELSSLMNPSLLYLLICPEPQFWFWGYPWKTKANPTPPALHQSRDWGKWLITGFLIHSFITFRALSLTWHPLTRILSLLLVFNFISYHKGFFFYFISLFPPKLALSCSLTGGLWVRHHC